MRAGGWLRAVLAPRCLEQRPRLYALRSDPSDPFAPEPKRVVATRLSPGPTFFLLSKKVRPVRPCGRAYSFGQHRQLFWARWAAPAWGGCLPSRRPKGGRIAELRQFDVARSLPACSFVWSG